LLKPHPPLVIVSLDGYAHYYLDRKLQPSFDRIAKCGVTSETSSSSTSRRHRTRVMNLVILAASAMIAYFLLASTTTHSNECSRKCSKPNLLKPHPPLVIVSLDGYAHYYLDRKLQPSFDRIAKCGVTSERVFSSFPTLTFPNHFTMATGKHPGHHGLVANVVYDNEVAKVPLYLGKHLLDGYYLTE
ncbi:hypothetical protein OSTOST_06364, partial [Ostertagia ostertagi]